MQHLFPDGVVDSSPNEIQSIDDALLQQINALTPSLHKASRQTVTQEGTQTLLPKPQPIIEHVGAPHGDRAESVQETSAKDCSHQTRQVRRCLHECWLALDVGTEIVLLQSRLNQQDKGKRNGLASLFLSKDHQRKTLAAPIALHPGAIIQPVITERRGTIEFVITGPALEQTTFNVDDAIHKPSDELPLGRTYLVCANASGFERTCQRIRLEKESNRYSPLN